jgi:hypothetical protein
LSCIGVYGLQVLGLARELAHQRFFGQPKYVMKCLFYDIIGKAIAAQRFPASSLLADAWKCHETCGYVTFCEICVGCF